MNPSPSDFPSQAMKFGGRSCILRSLASGDEDRLIAFFQSHTPETVEDRYGYRMAGMTREKAAQLVNVNSRDGLALGILESGPDGEILHAVGRYCTSPKSASGELAFVVRETLRHRGMARALLRNLVDTARNRGLRELWAQVGGSNCAMRSLLERHGFTRIEGCSGSESELRLHRLLV